MSDFGMPTLIEHGSLAESARLCHKLGLQFIELNMNMPQYSVERLGKIQNLKDLARKYELYYTIHLDENLNVCDFNRAVASAYRDTVDSTVQIAGELKIPICNMHMNDGVYFTLPDQRVYLFQKYEDYYLERLEQFRDMCEDRIGMSGTRIAIENTDGFLPFQKKGIELLLESSVFCLTWDIGHSHAAEDVDEDFLLAHEERIAHFHIHDAVGKKNHLALGTGETDIKGRLRIAEKNLCRCVLETKTAAALAASAEWLKTPGNV